MKAATKFPSRFVADERSSFSDATRLPVAIGNWRWASPKKKLPSRRDFLSNSSAILNDVEETQPSYLFEKSHKYLRLPYLTLLLRNDSLSNSHRFSNAAHHVHRRDTDV